MIGMDWIAGIPTRVARFDMIQNQVDLLSRQVQRQTLQLSFMTSDSESCQALASPKHSRWSTGGPRR